MRILVLNSGSSSLKFLLGDATSSDSAFEATRVVAGVISGVGGTAELRLQEDGRQHFVGEQPIPDHDAAIRWMFEALRARGGTAIEAVGHRIVHGGEAYRQSVLVDDRMLGKLEALRALAPLHNPAGLAGLHAVRAILGDAVPMVAVFDTAFHRTLPPRAARYALPSSLSSRHGIRRYGFHGIAHGSLADGYAACTGRALTGQRLITLQLGNGCSVAAIQNGASVDTSMGFTPLEGLVMGTRTGDLDPAIVPYLMTQEGVAPEEVERWLNECSGLLGVSGLSRDMRRLLEAEAAGHAEAALAVEMFCYRARKYIGAYLAVLGGADALVFGGGIGEHQPEIRARICRDFGWAGLELDATANAQAVSLAPGAGVRISAVTSALAAYVVAVDEERAIALETARLLWATRAGR